MIKIVMITKKGFELLETLDMEKNELDEEMILFFLNKYEDKSIVFIDGAGLVKDSFDGWKTIPLSLYTFTERIPEISINYYKAANAVAFLLTHFDSDEPSREAHYTFEEYATASYVKDLFSAKGYYTEIKSFSSSFYWRLIVRI